MDFEGNAERIIQSIQIAKERGATFRTGPELEITYLTLTNFTAFRTFSYFYSGDTDVWITFLRMIPMFILGNCCAESFLIRTARTFYLISECMTSYKGKLIGDRPVRHRSVYYNCRVIVYNKYIHLIRPKMWLANDGNYRERRYFQCWRAPKYVEEHDIPMAVWGLLESKQVQNSPFYQH